MQLDQAGEEDAEYDDAAQALLERLGGRVGFDRRGRVNMIDLSGTLVTALVRSYSPRS